MDRTKTGLIAITIGLMSATAASADNSPLRIGVLAPSTGPSSITGAPFEQGARLLLDNLQKNGLSGHPVQFTFFDTEGAGPKAVQLFNRLVDNDEVHIVLGPVNSGESIPIAPLANQLKVPVLCICSAEAITKPPTPYVFGLAPVDAVVVDELLGVLKERKVKRVALIYSLDAYGQSGGKILESRMAHFGLELSNVETFAPGDTNMMPQLLSIRGKNPDAIILWSAANPAPAIILKSAKDLGIKNQFYLGNAAAFNGFVEQAGAAADGAYVTSLPILAPDVLDNNDPRKAILADFAKSFEARWGKAPDQTAGGAMDGVLIIQEAVKMITGPITRDSLRDAVEKVKICGSYGCRQFTAQDHRGHGDRATTVLMQIKDSRWQPVQR